MPQLIIGAIAGLLIAIFFILKYVFKGTIWGFKKMPLTMTLIVLSVASVPFYTSILKDFTPSFSTIASLLFITAVQCGFYYLIVVATKKVRASRVDKNADAGELQLRKELINSAHLQDFFAPAREYTDRETKEILTKERVAVVQSRLVHVRRMTEKKVLQYEVRFRVTSDLETFRKKLPNVQHELALDEIKMDTSFSQGGFYQMIIIPSKANNPLTQRTLTASDFYSNLPMADRKWSSVPVGLNEDLDTVYMPMTHTLIGGVSGSGKGSAIQSFFQYYLTAPKGEESFYDQGLVEFYLIDPKNAEFAPYANAEFAKTITDPDTGDEWKYADERPETHAYTINAFFERMNQRIKYGGNRGFAISKQTPLLLLVIDEMLDASQTFSKDTKAQLRSIMVKGRSMGMFVVGATQEVTKEALPNRDNFTNKVALRLEKQADAATLFGKDAGLLADAGVRPEEIQPANAANSYGTAGQAFLFNMDTNDYQLMRFFYTSDADIENIKHLYTPEIFLNQTGPELPEGTVL